MTLDVSPGSRTGAHLSGATDMTALLLSSVLNMEGEFASISKTIQALSMQTARDALEVIIIARRAHAASIDHERMRAFGAYQVVEVDSLSSGAYGSAEGFRRARAPLVVISEDHGFPAPNWAQTLIDAHRREDCIAVCPAIENANPDTCTSWANYLLSFVEWFAHDSQPPRAVMAGAGHNTSYKREPLLAEYGGAALDQWLNAERVLHADFGAKGKRIVMDPRTRVRHVNLSIPSAFFGVSYVGGRVFGAVSTCAPSDEMAAAAITTSAWSRATEISFAAFTSHVAR